MVQQKKPDTTDRDIWVGTVCGIFLVTTTLLDEYYTGTVHPFFNTVGWVLLISAGVKAIRRNSSKKAKNDKRKKDPTEFKNPFMN